MVLRRKARWRKVSISGAERHLDDAPLRARALELDRTNQLFSIDTEGADDNNHLSHGVRRLLRRQQLRIHDKDSSSSKKLLLEVASKAHKQQLLRVIRGGKKRQETLNRKKAIAQAAAEGAVDLWGDGELEVTTKSKSRAAPPGAAAAQAAAAAAAGRKRRRCRLEALRSLVPAVALPGESVSYNPSEETQQQQLIAAAAAAVLEQQEGCSAKSVVRKWSQQQQPEQQQQLLLQQQDPLKALKHKEPVKAALLQHLAPEQVEALSDLERQSLLLKLATTGSLREGPNAAEETVERAAGGAAEGAPEGAAEAGASFEDEEAAAARALRKPKKKTRTDRNRQRRHEHQLRQAAFKRQRKALGKSIDQLPLLLQQLQEQQKQQAELRAKRDANRRVKEGAARRGVVAIKLGRRQSVWGMEEGTLLGDFTGSLRTTRVKGAAAAAVDRLGALHRRGMLELPARATGVHAARVKKQLRKVAASRKARSPKVKGIHAV